jgi:hypothetical protein
VGGSPGRGRHSRPTFVRRLQSEPYLHGEALVDFQVELLTAGIAAHARAHGANRLLVGTADSSRGTIAFYRACGFGEAGRVPGFFDAYPQPVVEDGVQAHDMIRLVMTLSEGITS